MYCMRENAYRNKKSLHMQGFFCLHFNEINVNGLQAYGMHEQVRILKQGQ